MFQIKNSIFPNTPLVWYMYRGKMWVNTLLAVYSYSVEMKNSFQGENAAIQYTHVKICESQFVAFKFSLPSRYTNWENSSWNWWNM